MWASGMRSAPSNRARTSESTLSVLTLAAETALSRVAVRQAPVDVQVTQLGGCKACPSRRIWISFLSVDAAVADHEPRMK